MSDLLPLIAATLKEKVLLDLQEEHRILKEKAKFAEMVEIIHRPVKDTTTDSEGGMDESNNETFEIEDIPIQVYASGSIKENGRYSGNAVYWEVSLQSQKPCRLEDLGHCRIQVGGGYEIATLANLSPTHEGFFIISDVDTRNSKSVSIYFSETHMWLRILVKGWYDWQQDREDGLFEFHVDEAIDYLCNGVAYCWPNAIVEFLSISFHRNTIHSALRRLIPKTQMVNAPKIQDQRWLEDTEVSMDIDDITIEGIPNEIRKVVMTRFNMFSIEGPEQQQDRSLEELMDMLPPILEVLDIDVAVSADEFLLDRIVILYIDHGKEVLEERYRSMRDEL